MIRIWLRAVIAAGLVLGVGTHGSAQELAGTIVDAATDAPVAGAIITAGDHVVRADASGHFRIDASVDRLGVRAVSYRRTELRGATSTAAPLKIRLAPFTPRALYLSSYGIGSTKLREDALRLIRNTTLNALVIDLKNERGLVAYPTASPLAEAIGARRTITVPDLHALVRSLHDQGIYLIARIVVCRDDLLAAARPGLAIRRRNGEPYRDGQGMRWVDPADVAVRDYNLAIAVEAARAGFDEIQLDYLRFPDAADVRLPGTDTERSQVINAFLDAVRTRLTPYNVYLAMDVFGYVCWAPGDLRIGQQLEDILPRVDYLSPMLYPSGFTFGIPGCTNPVANVYTIVRRSLEQVLARAHASPQQLRPWLQAFKDYAFDRRDFGANEIRAQIRAADELGTNGWMLWNPRNVYTDRGLAPPRAVGAAGSPDVSQP